MLLPADKRSKRFLVASRLEFDPVRVGLSTEPTSSHGFWFDTSIPGNRNTGHEFRAGYQKWKEGDPPAYGVIGPELTDEQRWQIIEYLKTRMDDDVRKCSDSDYEATQPPVNCPQTPPKETRTSPPLARSAPI